MEEETIYCEMEGCDWEATQVRTTDSENKVNLCSQCCKAYDLGFEHGCKVIKRVLKQESAR